MGLLLIVGLFTGACASVAVTPQPDLRVAQAALTDYFAHLDEGRYAEAAELYGGSYEALQGWNPGVDPADHATLLENGCTINGLQCLPLKSVLAQEAISDDTYQFMVTFATADGETFVLGPCCGADETEMPPQSEFTFTVVKVGDAYRVQELPVYVP
jgi:hypothetical protein